MIRLSLLMAVLLCWASVSSGAGMVVNPTSVQVFSNGVGGGCMVIFSPTDAIFDQIGIGNNGAVDGQCYRGFLSLDCDGNHIGKAQSSAMFNAVQLAYVAGKRMYVEVDVTKKNNGYCVPSRLDVAD